MHIQYVTWEIRNGKKVTETANQVFIANVSLPSAKCEIGHERFAPDIRHWEIQFRPELT